MRFLHTIGVTVLLSLTLAACGKQLATSTGVRFDTTDPGRVAYLVDATERVIVRKLKAMGLQNPQVIALPEGDNGATLQLTLKNEDELNAVRGILTEKFTFDIRVEKDSSKEATINDPENWEPTALTGSSLIWAQPVAERETEKISIELQFNDNGREILTKIFSENKGKAIGIFVRGLLVSKLTIDTIVVSDRILISGVPSSNIAEVFADDVNVGLHATFAPLTQ